MKLTRRNGIPVPVSKNRADQPLPKITPSLPEKSDQSAYTGKSPLGMSSLYSKFKLILIVIKIIGAVIAVIVGIVTVFATLHNEEEIIYAFCKISPEAACQFLKHTFLPTKGK